MDAIRKQIQEEVDRNYAELKKILQSIIAEHENEYALMKEGKIIEYFTTYNDAIKAGDITYSDKIYSIQKVEGKSISLGHYSYA